MHPVPGLVASTFTKTIFRRRWMVLTAWAATVTWEAGLLMFVECSDLISELEMEAGPTFVSSRECESVNPAPWNGCRNLEKLEL